MPSLEDKTLPPPPPEGDLEVTIRTLASDLELLQKGGGSISYARASEHTVTLGHGGHAKMEAEVAEAASSELRDKNRFQMLVWGVVCAVGIAIFFVIGRYVVPRLLGGVTPDAEAPAKNTETQAPNAASKKVEPTFLGHVTFFRTTVPVIDLDLYAQGTPPDRVSFARDLRALAAADPDTSLHEIIVRGIESRPLAWSELVRFLGAEALDYPVLQNNFVRDYTMFAYRDVKGGISPGFIFRLKDGITPLMLQRDIFQLESSPQAFAALFPGGVGAPEQAFHDAQVSGQPARALTFSNPTSTLTYGWFFNSYIIVSTSDTGLKMALERL